MKNDHLFEWYLFQQTLKRARSKVENQAASATVTMNRPRFIPKTDIQRLFLSYNQSGQLSLADVRPAGFIVKVSG